MKKNIKSNTEEYLKNIEEDKKVRISVTIDKKVLSSVLTRIKKKNVPLSRLVNVLLMDFLVNYEDIPETKKSNVTLKE
jgi:hypothetical protein